MKNKLKTGAVLTCLSIGLLHVVNKCICTASTLNNMLFWGDGQTFHWRFGNIYYRKSGSGSPILLIHDLSPFSSSYEWHLLEEELAQKHTVYTLDLLGCGRSDKPNMTYTNYLYVQLNYRFYTKSNWPENRCSCYWTVCLFCCDGLQYHARSVQQALSCQSGKSWKTCLHSW